MEKETSDALEVAAQKNEKRKKEEKTAQIKKQVSYISIINYITENNNLYKKIKFLKD